MKLFKNIENTNMKLEEAKNEQNLLESNLHKIKKEDLNQKRQKNALENIKMLYSS